MIFIMFNSQLTTLVSQKALKVVLLLIAGIIAKKIISLLVKKLRLAKKRLGEPTSVQQEQRLKTIRSLIKNTSKIIINFIILVMILAELGVNITPLITGAGILGLAVGFGAKSLVADLIAGFFIILENQFNVGDQVQIANHQGKVTKITLRTITLKDKNKKIYIVPNSSIKTVVRFPKTKKLQK